MQLPAEVIDFYLIRAPYAHSDKPDSAQSVDLSKYKWEKANLDRLMKWIVIEHRSGSGISFSVSNAVPEKADKILEAFRNAGNIGGVFTIRNKISSSEDNALKCRLSEAYATCFFRHIRNAIAHGNYRMNEAGFVVFKDQAVAIDSKDPKLTAAFVTTTSFLMMLIDVVKGGPEAIKDDEIASCPRYRVNKKIETDVVSGDE